MERIHNKLVYKYYEYPNEAEFESEVVKQASYIFGKQTIYIDIKKRIGRDILTIPDGYLIDLSFSDDPRLYIIENELSTHDPYDISAHKSSNLQYLIRKVVGKLNHFYWIILNKIQTLKIS